MISGGSDSDQAKDGDHVDHAGRYRRTAEYIEVLRKTWTHSKPFDHKGEFYEIVKAYSEVRCLQQPNLPVYGGGGSDAAVAALAPHVDEFMLWGEPLKETAEFMAKVRAVAGANPLTFSVSTRPILGKTEGQAWDRAHKILDQIKANFGDKSGPAPQNVGSQRLLDLAAAREVHDSCLYTALAQASGARGNSTALVGTPETVAQAMVAYYDLGAKSLLIRGYDPLPDAIEYGQELIPRVRELVADRDRARDRQNNA
jgi:alkanesulfonate monooxygenase